MSQVRRLPDVNALVPLLWPAHVHHAAVQAWFSSVRNAWATCPLTQLGCLRVLATPAVSRGTLTLAGAYASLTEILADPGHAFWPDNLPVSDLRFAGTVPFLQGPAQITDRYLLALAAAHGGVLATFDRSIAAGLPANSPLRDHVEIIPT